MKKLEKKNRVIVDSLETYLTCTCSCYCACPCNCYGDASLQSNIMNTNDMRQGSGVGGQHYNDVSVINNS